MKKFKLFSVITLLFALVALVGCSSSFGEVRGDLEEAGFTYDEKINDQYKDLLKGFEEKGVKVTPHYFKKGFDFALVLEFKTTKEMDKQIEESETLKGFIKDLKETDIVRGNCLLIPVGFNKQDIILAFQGK